MAAIETALSGLRDHIQRSHANLLEQYPQRWLLLNLLEGDGLVFKTANIPAGSLPPQLFEHLLRGHGEDIEGLLADTRYALSSGLCREILTKPEKRSIEMTERIDRVVLNRYLGIPIFAAAMFFLFKLTFDLSGPYGDWIDGVLNGPVKRWATAGLGAISAPDWTVSPLMTVSLPGLSIEVRSQ